MGVIRSITFDKSAKEQMLDIFDKAVDSEGYIVEKGDMKQRVLMPNGEHIHIDEWAGVRPARNGVAFIKTDLPSLIELLDFMKRKDAHTGAAE